MLKYSKSAEKEVQSAIGGCRGFGGVPQTSKSPKTGGQGVDVEHFSNLT